MKRRCVFVVLTIIGIVCSASVMSCKKNAEQPTGITKPAENGATPVRPGTPKKNPELLTSTTKSAGNSDTRTAPGTPKELMPPATKPSTRQDDPALQAKMKHALVNIDGLKSALLTFEVDCGRFPTTEEGLQALVGQPSGVKDWKQLIDEVPLDPWGNPYHYQSPGQHSTDFDIWSYGPDGQPGTDDDITSWTRK